MNNMLEITLLMQDDLHYQKCLMRSFDTIKHVELFWKSLIMNANGLYSISIVENTLISVVLLWFHLHLHTHRNHLRHDENMKLLFFYPSLSSASSSQCLHILSNYIKRFGQVFLWTSYHFNSSECVQTISVWVTFRKPCPSDDLKLTLSSLLPPVCSYRCLNMLEKIFTLADHLYPSYNCA